MNKNIVVVRLGIVAAGFVAAVLTVGALATTAGAQTEAVQVGSASIAPGAEGSVAVQALDIADPGLGAWSIDITYDAAVVTAVDCDASAGGVCNPAYDSDTVRVVGANASGLEGDSELASISFRCDVEGTSALDIAIVNFADATPGDLQPIAADTIDGTVTCSASAAGGAGVIHMESGQAGVGAEVILDLDAQDIGPPGLGAWTVDVQYDNTVATAVACLPQNGGVCNAAFSDDTVRSTGANAQGLEGDNILAKLTFRCDVEGETDLTLTVQVLVDATVGDPQFIDASIVNGTLTCGEEPPPGVATATPTTMAPAPPEAGTGDFSPGSAGYFGLLVAGLVGAGVAWLIAGAAGAKLAPAALRLPGSQSGSVPAPAATATRSRPQSRGSRWFQSARRGLSDEGLPSVIRFRRVVGQDKDD